MLLDSHRAYLLSRTYTNEMIDREEITSEDQGLITWTCRSMSGQLLGHQTTRPHQHEYRWVPAQGTAHLATLYGTEEDHDLLYSTGKLILVEGIFDRAATKRAAPGYACYARLSKGVGGNLLTLLKRYAKTTYLLFDQDGPGQDATESAEKKLAAHADVHTIKIPAKDPAALLEKRGEKKAREIILPQIKIWE